MEIGINRPGSYRIPSGDGPQGKIRVTLVRAEVYRMVREINEEYDAHLQVVNPREVSAYRFGFTLKPNVFAPLKDGRPSKTRFRRENYYSGQRTNGACFFAYMALLNRLYRKYEYTVVRSKVGNWDSAEEYFSEADSLIGTPAAGLCACEGGQYSADILNQFNRLATRQEEIAEYDRRTAQAQSGG